MAITVPIISEWNPQGVNRSLADIKRAEGGWSKAGVVAEKAFLPAVGAFTAGAAAAYKFAGQASDLNETMTKTEAIFGKGSQAIKDWSTETAGSMGISQQAALDAAASFGVIGKGAGLTGGELTGFSKDLTGLAADMASFNNTSVDEAITALSSGLRGESEPLRKFGVMLDDATLRQEAVRLGIIKTTSQALKPQQKALAAQAAIMKQTSDQQGDFAKTSEGAANQQRIMEAQLQDATTQMGSAFLPVLQTVTTALAEVAGWMKENESAMKLVIPVVLAISGAIILLNVALKGLAIIKSVIALVKGLNLALLSSPWFWVIAAVVLLALLIYKNWDKIKEWTAKLFGWLTPYIKGAWDKVRGWFDAALDWIKNAVGVAWDILKTIFRYSPWGIVLANLDNLKRWFGAALDWVRDKVRVAWDVLKTIFRYSPWGIVLANLDKLKAGFSAVFDFIVDKVEAAWERIQEILSKIGDALGAVGGALDRVNPFSSDAATVTRLAGVPATDGSGITRLASGVETGGSFGVSRSGGQGPTIIIQGALDPEGVARQVKRLLESSDVRQGRGAGQARAVAW